MCCTRARFAASTTFASCCCSDGVSGASKYSLSTPFSALTSVSTLSRSPTTTSTVVGSLPVASFGSRTRARTLWPAFASCLTTSEPTFPVEPVMRIMRSTMRFADRLPLLDEWGEWTPERLGARGVGDHRLAVAHVARARDCLRGALADGGELGETGVALRAQQRDRRDRDRHDRELPLHAEPILRLDRPA